MEILPLNDSNLSRISGRISCPVYDRQKLKTGIVHIGVGGFHRSHQALYLHRILAQNQTDEWGICGIGLREGDRKMYDVLKHQDFLYTLIARYPDGNIESTVIGAIIDFLLAVDTPDKVIDKMAHSDTRIVSLTITEGGYNFDPVNGEFNFDHPDIRHEIAHPNDPKTVYGFLTAALRKRRERAVGPFTILSCDNIQHNGAMIRKMLLAFINKQDPDLADWVAQTVNFPNTMVDRITPVTTQQDINYLRDTHGILDAWPVTCEPFIQWVVEDNFSSERPPLEKLGVQFVPDVSPFEKMKIRLLNAGHSVLGIPGAIHGHPTINACMEDPVFVTFMRKFMDQEATPVLDPVEGIDLATYKDTLAERFSNPNIKDSVARICSESSAKLPKFLIPTLQENLQQRNSIRYATLVLAAWCYYSDKQVDKNGEPLNITDAMKNELNQFAAETSNDTAAFLRLNTIFGDLIQNKHFLGLYEGMILTLYENPDIRELMKTVIEWD